MSKTKRHRPARWAIGLPGHPPSRPARHLASSPRLDALPSGVWHVSDHAADLLACTAPVVASAIHALTGAAFRLLSVPDGPILAIAAEDDAARSLVAAAWSDPQRLGQ